jgi:ribonuclease D
MNEPINSQNYPRISFSGKIHLITNNQELRAVLPLLKAAKQLGFDTETKPSFKKGEVFQSGDVPTFATETDAFLIQAYIL